ncbi:MAG: DUF547 domain-containing protein [Verrucomicrobia bacterium]|nr:DUF547 domain-containing protein [Verrucomicrobiota bacterium]
MISPECPRVFSIVSKLILSFAVLSAAGFAEAAGPFDQSHARFARVLGAVVQDARVDYAKLKASPAELDGYLQDVAAVPAAEFARWPEADRLALLINLYNAQTLRLIIDHYPLASIRSIGMLPGAAWREPVVRQGGLIMTLDHLENKVIRVQFREPRIHFALVCAAVGCPPLRAEPYVGARLNDQLDDQARRFLGAKEKNRFDPATGTLNLSPIFKWYAEDFTAAAGSVAAYVKAFLPEAQRQALSDPAKVKVTYTDYDWALNELKRR